MGEKELEEKGAAWVPSTPAAANYVIILDNKGVSHVGFVENPLLSENLEKERCNYVSNRSGGIAKKVSFMVSGNSESCFVDGVSENRSNQETIDIEVPSAVKNHNQGPYSECGLDPKKNPSTPKNKTPKKRSMESIDSEKKPRKKMKIKRHRPKVFDESKPMKPSTPNPRTPKRAIPVRKGSLKKTRVDESKDVVREEAVGDCNKNSCRRKLDFDIVNLDMDGNKSACDGIITNKPDVIPEVEPINRFGLVYRRTLKPNECLKNSRKSGPNCPRVFKKTRTRRQRPIAFDKFILFRTNPTEVEQRRGVKNELMKSCQVATSTEKRSLNRRLIKRKKSPRASKRAEEVISHPRCALTLTWMVKLKRKRSKRSIRRQEYSSFVKDISELKFSDDFLLKASNIRKKVAAANVEVEGESAQLSASQESIELQMSTEESLEVQLFSTQESVAATVEVEDESLRYLASQESTEFPEDNLVSCSVLESDTFDYPAKKGRSPLGTSMLQTGSFSVNLFFNKCETKHGTSEFPAYCQQQMIPYSVVPHHEQKNVSSSFSGNLVFFNKCETKHGTSEFPAYCQQQMIPYSVVPHHEQKNVSSCKHYFTEAQVDFLVQRTTSLRIDDGGCMQLVMRDQNNCSTLVPSKGKFDPSKTRKTWAKVDLDDETLRVWNLIMEKGENVESLGQEDEDKAKYWKEQREIFAGRVELFISRMHLVQGDRRFSPWKGSVVDSIAGVFLTQNVSDSLSSNAFMELPARFPPVSVSDHNDDGEGTNHSEIHETEEAEITELPSSTSHTEIHETQQAKITGLPSSISHSEIHETQQAKITGLPSSISHSEIHETEVAEITELPSSTSHSEIHETEEVEITELPSSTSQQAKITELPSNTSHSEIRETEEAEITELPSSTSQSEIHEAQQAKITELHSSKHKDFLTMENFPSTGLPNQAESTPGKKKGKGKDKQENPINWDELRKKASNGVSKKRTRHNMDSVNWEAIRQAPVKELADLIMERGMNNILAGRIKDFLDRIVRDHGGIDLEWLRDVPPDQAKEYLLSITGLGLKSVECVRLLTLHHHAFPVDVNVGRILVRLGWVPLQTLPDDVQIHLLDQYPYLDTVQKYIWPRICHLGQPTLYEFHYQMITFGKAFCTKKAPNCNACPMRGECRHFASAYASARLRLNDTPGSNSNNCEPIVEHPPSPSPSYEEPDIEDFGLEEKSCNPSIKKVDKCIEVLDFDSDDIPTIELNSEEFKKNVLSFVDGEKEDTSKSLVSVNLERASIPTPQMKYIGRLRTQHLVYELPDSHPLLEGFEKREPDDPCPYLLAIWLTDESANSSKEPNTEIVQYQNDQIVRGTILIPCRTANRGAFPLNGTYFQVNEVFADHESSHHPIPIPRAWIWNLRRRILFCGTSTTSISRGLNLHQIQFCFRKGFICIRGYDKVRRAAKSLATRFHLCKTRHVDEE